jgi:hypothetical protein
MRSPTDVLAAILKNPTDIDNVRSLTTPDVTYVSLNYGNPDLKKVMPWAGTSKGPESIVMTFVDVARFWRIEAFDTDALFGSTEFAAMFGRFTYRSAVVGKIVTSPFAVFAKVAEGRCTYLQFMEDTFATAASFRTGGSWLFRSDPDGKEVVI